MFTHRELITNIRALEDRVTKLEARTELTHYVGTMFPTRKTITLLEIVLMIMNKLGVYLDFKAGTPDSFELKKWDEKKIDERLDYK